MRSGKLSGSLTKLTDGTSYLVAGQNIAVVSQSNGSVQISLQGSVGELSASYLVLTATSSLANERALTVGTGLSGTDGGAGGAYTLAIDNSVVATVSGTTFTGPGIFNGGLTGSLQRVSAGVPYLVSGPNITINTSSSGQVSITGSAAGGAAGEVSASYVVLALTSSLANERVLTAGNGITITDGGANSTVTISAITGSIYSASFTNSSLSSGILAVTHSLGYKYVSCAVYDQNDLQVLPTDVKVIGTSILTVDLKSFTPLIGTWTVAVQGTTGPKGDTGPIGLPGQFTPEYFTSTTNGAVFSTGSVAIRGSESISTPASKGSDVFFYVSGSSSSKSVFGGDVRVSGTLVVGTGSITITSNDIQFGGTATRFERAGNDIKFYDSSSPAGKSLTQLVSGSGTINGVDTSSSGAILYVSSSGTITGSQQNMYWDVANSRLGIGTTAPTVKLDVSAGAIRSVVTTATQAAIFQSSNSDTNVVLNSAGVMRLANGNSTANNNISIDFYDGTLNVVSRIATIVENHSTHAGGFSFVTRNASLYDERLKIDSTGSVCVGNFYPRARLHISGSSTAAQPTVTIQEGVPSAAGTAVFEVKNASGANLLHVSGSGMVHMSGTVMCEGGFSGSLTKLANGTSFIIAAPGMSVVSGASGAVSIQSDGSTLYAVLTSGSANTYSASFTPSFSTAPAAGTQLVLKSAVSNMTGSTLNVDNTGAASIQFGSTQLEANHLVSGSTHLVVKGGDGAWKVVASDIRVKSFNLTAPTAVTSGTAYTVSLLSNSRVIRTLAGTNVNNTSYLEFTIPYDFVDFTSDGYSLDTTRSNAGCTCLVTLGNNGTADSALNALDLIATATDSSWETKSAKPTGRYKPGDRVLVTISATTSGNTQVQLGTCRITYLAR